MRFGCLMVLPIYRIVDTQSGPRFSPFSSVDSFSAWRLWRTAAATSIHSTVHITYTRRVSQLPTMSTPTYARRFGIVARDDHSQHANQLDSYMKVHQQMWATKSYLTYSPFVRIFCPLLFICFSVHLEYLKLKVEVTTFQSTSPLGFLSVCIS